MPKAALLSVCHGGGPMPILGDPGHKDLIKSLSGEARSVLKIDSPDKPRAILILTAHWETPEPQISNASKHDLYYDYSGFPEKAYTLDYNAPGSPEVAQMVGDLLARADIKYRMNDKRGWDHGVFVPLTLINPSANIPIVQMSVLRSQSPTELYRLGQALRPLRDANVAILGSGSASWHNLRELFTGGTSRPNFRAKHDAWAKAMDKAIQDGSEEAWTGWRKWPHANEMHPPGAAEHLSPQIVCAGAGSGEKVASWADELMGVSMKSYYWT